MSKREKLRDKILRGDSIHNITFQELCRFVEDCGFVAHKGNGSSHRVYAKQGIPDIVNLQQGSSGKAKSYQVRQIRDIASRFGL